MPAVLTLLDSPQALAAVRRGLSRGRTPVVAARSPAALRQGLHDRLVDAVVLGPRAAGPADLADLRHRFPSIPIIIFGVLRADDAGSLLLWHRLGVRSAAVEGVDDAVVGEVVSRHTASAIRRAGLAGAPALLRLSEKIQARAWQVLLENPGAPITTEEVARRLAVSREHLSRQFGAGGAPNLKRVIDFLRVVAASELASNPGYDLGRVAALTSFASANHLRATAHRVTGLPLEGCLDRGAEEILSLFVRSGMRSRG